MQNIYLIIRLTGRPLNLESMRSTIQLDIYIHTHIEHVTTSTLASTTINLCLSAKQSDSDLGIIFSSSRFQEVTTVPQGVQHYDCKILSRYFRSVRCLALLPCLIGFMPLDGAGTSDRVLFSRASDDWWLCPCVVAIDSGVEV